MAPQGFTDKYIAFKKRLSVYMLTTPSITAIVEFCDAFDITRLSVINGKWTPDDYHLDNTAGLKNVISLFKNSNMWLIIFKEMTSAVFINEASLRKINYFDAFITHNNSETMNDPAYYSVPNGAKIYCVELNKEPFNQILYYSTYDSILDSFMLLNCHPLSKLIELNNGPINNRIMDMYFVEAFNGIKNLELQTLASNI